MQSDALNLFGGFAGIGVLTAGLGFAYAQFKSGAGKAKDDLIAILKDTAKVEHDKAERLDGEKTALLANHQEQINQLTEKIGKLQGLYEAAEQRSKEYLEILQGRSPEQTKFMEALLKAAAESGKTTKDAKDYMETTAKILNEIKIFMAMMNAEIAKGNYFNQQVEEATKSGDGEPLRKKV